MGQLQEVYSHYAMRGSVFPSHLALCLRYRPAAQTSNSPASDAILNAVTYQLDPFAVQTAQNRGSDKRTRLAIFGTGFRYAGNPTHDPSGTMMHYPAMLLKKQRVVRGLLCSRASPAP